MIEYNTGDKVMTGICGMALFTICPLFWLFPLFGGMTIAVVVEMFTGNHPANHIDACIGVAFAVWAIVGFVFGYKNPGPVFPNY